MVGTSAATAGSAYAKAAVSTFVWITVLISILSSPVKGFFKGPHGSKSSLLHFLPENICQSNGLISSPRKPVTTSLNTHIYEGHFATLRSRKSALSSIPKSRTLIEYVSSIPKQPMTPDDVSEKLKIFYATLEKIGIDQAILAKMETQSTGSKLNKRLQWTDGSTSRNSFVTALSGVLADTITIDEQLRYPPSENNQPDVTKKLGTQANGEAPSSSQAQRMLLIGSENTLSSMASVSAKLAWKMQQPATLSSRTARSVLVLPTNRSEIPHLQTLLTKNSKQFPNVALFTNFDDISTDKDKAVDTESSAVKLAQKAVEEADRDKFDVVVMSTTIDEVATLRRALDPTEILAVVDLAKDDIQHIFSSYQKEFNITGLVLTVMDGSSGDGLLNTLLKMPSLSRVPVKYLIHGDKITDIFSFQAGQVIDALLGNGIDDDILTEQDKKDLEELRQFGKVPGFMRKNRRKGVDFTYNDYREQVTELAALGGMQKVIDAFQEIGLNSPPSFTKKRIADAEERAKKAIHIIDSMSPAERAYPELLARETGKGLCLRRRMALAKRANLHITEIEDFVKKFVLIRKEMCNIERQMLPVESESPTSRLVRLREKRARALESTDKGFGPPIRNSVQDPLKGLTLVQRWKKKRDERRQAQAKEEEKEEGRSQVGGEINDEGN